MHGRSFGCNEYGLVRFLAWFGRRFRRLIYAYESELVRLPLSSCPSDLHLFRRTLMHSKHTHSWSSNYCIYEIQLLLLLLQLLHRHSSALVCAFRIQSFGHRVFLRLLFTAFIRFLWVSHLQVDIATASVLSFSVKGSNHVLGDTISGL